MKKKLISLVLLFVVAIVSTTFNFTRRVEATVPGVTTMMSVNGAGTQSANADTSDVRLSGDGKIAVFSSAATDIVAGDTNGKVDVFSRDISTGQVEVLSKSTSGAVSNGATSVQAVSYTGRYVLMGSIATNLIDGRTISASYRQLYVHDRKTDTTTLISQSASGATGISSGSNKAIEGLDISSDGRFVLIRSNYINLATVTTTFETNLFMADTVAGTMTLLNIPTAGSMQNVSTGYARMSCDGAIVVFGSVANNLTAGDTNDSTDVFMIDRRAGSRMTNITASHNSWNDAPEISCNGNFVTFTSAATNIPGGTVDGSSHIYRYDVVDGVLDIIDQSSAGAVANSSTGGVNIHKVSDKGDVLFVHHATNLTPASATSSSTQVYVRDSSSQTTEMLSVTSTGAAGNNYGSSNPSGLSADGRHAVYASWSTNLVSITDANSAYDVFVSETGL